jgi:hypothetical protein
MNPKQKQKKKSPNALRYARARAHAHAYPARQRAAIVPVYYRWMDWVYNVVVVIGQMAGEK